MERMNWDRRDGMGLTVQNGMNGSRDLHRILSYAGDGSVGLKTENQSISHIAPNMIFPAPTNTTLKSLDPGLCIALSRGYQSSGQ